MIGKVPDGWRVEKLSAITDTVRNGVNLDQLDAGNIPISRIETISNGIVNFERVKYVNEISVEQFEKYLIHYNDILFSHINSPTHVGKTAIYKDTKEIIHGANLLLIRIKNENPDYVNYFIKKIKDKNYFYTRCNKAVNQASFKQSEILKIPIPLPPLPQQEKIVKVLDISSALIEKQKELIQKYDLFLKSKFIEMFGDPISNPMGWEVVQFQNIMLLQRGYDLPTYERKKCGSIKIFGSNGVLDYHDEAKVRGGGVITGRSGTLGKVHYTFEDYWPLNTTLFSKDLKGNNIIFLAFFLEMFKVDRFTQGAGVPTLNRNLVHKEKTYKISIELQNKFASMVEKTEQIKSQETKKLQHLETLHVSLMDKAFKGEIQ